MTKCFEVCTSKEAARAISATASDFFRAMRKKKASTAVPKVPALVCLPQMFALVDLTDELELKVESQDDVESAELILLRLPPGVTMGRLARAVTEQQSELATPVKALLAFVRERFLMEAGLSDSHNIELSIQVAASYLASAVESAVAA